MIQGWILFVLSLYRSICLWSFSWYNISNVSTHLNHFFRCFRVHCAVCLRFHVFDWGRCPVNMRTFLSVCLLWIRKIKLNGTYFSVLNSPENYDRFVWGLCGMSPSGHYWDYYPGSFSSLSSHCNSFEDRVPVDSSMGTQSSNELQWLYLTHLPLVPHICVIELGHHLFR